MEKDMTSTDVDEGKMLWAYVQEESNDLILRVKHQVEVDGFDKCAGGDSDIVASMILSLAMLKVLAIMCERTGSSMPDMYLKMAASHSEVLKMYVMQQFRQET